MAVNPFQYSQAQLRTQQAQSVAALAPTSALMQASGVNFNPFAMAESKPGTPRRLGTNQPLFGGPMLLGKHDGKDIYAGGRLYVQV